MNYLEILRICLAVIIFIGFSFRYRAVLSGKASAKNGRLLSMGLTAVVLYIGSLLVTVNAISLGAYAANAGITIVVVAMLEAGLKRIGLVHAHS